MRSFLLFVLSAALCLASAVDGRWSASIEAKKPKTGQTVTRNLTFDLKTTGAELNGTMQAGGRRAPAVAIQNGKLDGDRISFVTTQSSKDGKSRVFHWTGTLAGDDLRLTRVADGKKRGREIVAKRQ